MVDSHANLAYSLVATAPSPASSGTSLVVTTGQGALFPATPFNAMIWATGANPITTNAEIVRVTAISTDTLTIVRAQEGTSARTVIVGDQIAVTVTAKTMTDVEWAHPWYYKDEPLIIADGDVLIIPSGDLVWMDATVPTTSVIGVQTAFSLGLVMN